MGTPEMWCVSMIRLAVETVSSGGSVTGSAMMPFSALDLVHLAGLGLHAQILVDDANTPFLRQGNGQFALGHRVHRRRDDGDVEADVAGQVGAHVHVAGDDFGVGGFQEDIVERDAQVSDAVLHGGPRFGGRFGRAL